MRIKRLDTVTNKEKKDVPFNEVIKSFKELSNPAITYQLLNNQILKNGRFEFKRMVD